MNIPTIQNIMIVFVCIAMSGCAKNNVHHDVQVHFLARLNWIATRGEVRLVPSCSDIVCIPGEAEMLSSLRRRLDWNLKASMRAAKECERSATQEALHLRFVCASLIVMDAKSMYGLYGKASSLPVLLSAYTALKKNHALKAVGADAEHSTQSKQDGLSSNRSNILIKNMDLNKEIIHVSGSEYKIPLLPNNEIKIRPYPNQKNKSTSYAVTGIRGYYPRVRVYVNGVGLIFVVDTGSQETTISKTAASRAGIHVYKKLTEYGTSAQGRDFKEVPGVAESFVIGGLSIMHKYLLITSHHSHGVDGSIGLGVLDKFQSFAFDFNNGFFIMNAKPPGVCANKFHVSSDLIRKTSIGIIPVGTTFNDHGIAALLDTGNASNAVSPTMQLSNDIGIHVDMNLLLPVQDSSGNLVVRSGYVSGKLTFLGTIRNIHSYIGINLPGTGIDFDIGAPYFRNKLLYVDFSKMELCVLPDGPRTSMRVKQVNE